MKYSVLAIVFAVFASPVMAQDMTVDGTSKETYERSVKAMVDDMSDVDREAFGRGLMNLIVTGYPAAQGAEGLAMLQFMQPAAEAAHITLDGVSRDEIMNRGREIVAADTTKAESIESGVPLNETLLCLQEKIIVTNAQVESASYGRTISMDITNNLQWAIAGIRIDYIAFSEGRSVPWAKDDFSLSISGGIEPGETRKIRTSASLFPSEAPDELITTATVVDVTDPLERQIIQDVRVMGWGDEKSPMTCE